jgi:hypothetical protein
MNLGIFNNNTNNPINYNEDILSAYNINNNNLNVTPFMFGGQGNSNNSLNDSGF